MPLYNAGNAYLQVVPSFKGVEAMMKRELAKMGAQVDNALEKGAANGITEGVKAAGKDAVESLKRDADKAAGAFAAKFERRVGEALKSLGSKIKVRADTKDFDKDYNRIIKGLQKLGEKEIGPKFTARQAANDLDQLAQRMRSLENTAPDLNAKFNLRQARAEAESFLQDLRNSGAAAGTEWGRRLSSGFAQEMRKGVQGALGSLPQFVVDADTTPAQRRIVALRELLQRLDTDIELGIDDGVAEQRLRTIMVELEELDRFEADPSVAVNSGIALAKLAAVKKLMDAMDGDDIDVDIDVDRGGRAASSLRAVAEESGVTLSRLGYLVSIGGALGTALVPAAAAAAVAVSGIGFAAAGAASGIGVLFLAFNGIADAAKALHTYNQDADKSAKSLAQSQNQIASALDSVASAQDALESARESAADRQRAAAERIKAAEEDLNRARRDGVRAIRDAVEAAKDADRDYTRALIDQREAREALNEAYKQAVRDLADLNSQVRRNSLDQRQALLDEKEARAELDKILLNPRATEEEREQARITYERRVLQIEDLKRKGEELAEQQQDANKKGVEGSDAVRRAQDNLRGANEAVERAARAQRDSQEQLARVQEDSARRVSEAQADLLAAHRDGAKAQRDSQRQIAAAQRSLAAANRQLAQSYTAAGTAGGSALDTLQDKMADLSPAGQDFVYFLDDVMRPALDRLQKAAQEGLFPGLTEGLSALVEDGRLDGLADFVFNVADAMGDSFAYAVEQLEKPVWKEFFGYIGQTAGPVIRGAAEVALNFAEGLANIMNSLTGFNSGMGQGLIGFSEAFVRWSQRLTESQGFQQFITYVQQEGPHVLDLLQQFAIFMGRVAVAAAPIGAVVVRAFEAFLTLINKIPIEYLAIILGTIVALSGALLLLAAGTAIVTASIATLVTIGLTVLGAALAFLYTHFEGFRKAVDITFRAVGAIFNWLLHNVWIPFYVGLWKTLVWLWQNVVVPVFTGIINRAISLGDHLAQLWPIVEPVFTALGQAAIWLWQNVLKPALTAIVGLFQWLWFRVLKPILDYWSADTDEIARQQAGGWARIATVLRGFVAVLQFLWNSVIRPVVSAIGAVFTFLWRNVLVPVWQGITVAVRVAWAILSPIFTAIGLVIGVVVAVFRGLWWAVTEVWTGITIAIRVAWAVIQVTFGLVQIALKVLGVTFRALYLIFIRPWLNVAIALIRGFYYTVIRPVFNLAQSALRGLADGWNRIYRDHIEPFWTGFVDGIEAIYDEHIKPFIDALVDIWEDHILPAWRDGAAAVERIWEGLRNAPRSIVKFIVNTIMNDGLLAGYNRIAKFFHVKPDDVKITLPKGFATGGQIDGPGTGTSDSVLIRASAGEHMWTAAEVDALGGHGAMYALRRAVRHGWQLPGYANGGAIGDGFGDWLKKTAKSIGGKASDIFSSTVDFLKNPAESLKKLVSGLIDKLPAKASEMARVVVGMPNQVLKLVIDKVKGLFLGGGGQDGSTNGAVAGNSNSLGGSAGMINILRQVFPGLSLNSGFRPGSITVTGNLSYHARNRAIDVPPRRDVFEWIRSNFPASRELIFSPMGARQIWNGRSHVYSGAVRNTHWDHVHWAYDQGGYLQPGYSMVYNGTGQPEPVLTSKQWRDIDAISRTSSARGGNTYQFEFKDTTLDPGRLRAIQDREAALARAGRAR